MDDAEDAAEAKRLTSTLSPKLKHERCPLCETETWLMLNTTRNATRLVLADGSYQEVYTLICSNCGFVRQHLRVVADQ